jgi:polyferredoxin
MAKKKKSNIRLYIQIFFFVLVASIAVNHSLEEAGRALPLLSSASLHALCPFGGVVSIYQQVTTSTYVKQIHESSFILMYLAFLLALFFGPVFCGWVCPLGAVQEWFSRLGRRIFKKRFNHFIPYRFDKYLRFLRYIVLARVLYLTAVTGTLIFIKMDPYYALFNFWTGEVAVTALILLMIVLAASLFVERPFCKYICPYGAILGVFNLFRIFKIKRNAATCTDCKLCDRSCPMNITVSTSRVIRNHQCISCLECTSDYACPVTDTVELTTGKMISTTGEEE